MKICIVSSCGGHLTEVRSLAPAYDMFDHFYVLNDRVALSEDMATRTFFVAHSERDWRFLLNLYEAFRILRKHQPDVLLSTGAGPIVPFALVGKLFGVRTVFIESLTRVSEPSLTGRLMYRLADVFIYQWPGLASYFPRGLYGGTLV